MLNIYLGEMKEAIYHPPTYFDNMYEDEWITDLLSVKMIKDVDKSEVIGPHLIESPVLGPISPKELSGGVKTLMLMAYDENDRVFNASVCGDNCSKWILKLGKEKDLTINLRHIMDFGKEEFEAQILNTGQMVHTMKEFVEIAGEYINYSKDRVVVIISDALRYEVAHTLFEKMQADEKCNASIGAMQGVLPSYTPLGMASLLPHKTIEYSPSYDVLVDGKACSSTEQREAILKEYKINSKCVQFDSMKTMKQADLRSIFTGQDVVYIYHNQIDARGDKAASENEVFTACEEAIEEIYTLIKRIASQANTYHFIVTADHGFIYKRDKIQATDKIAGAASKSNSVGQRYSISAEEIKADGVCHTTVGKVLGSADERIVSFPLASDIFKVAGAGQNYVHGGCSPQEMLVPMIDVKVDKGKKETSLAEIALVSLTSKITNLITTLDFVQTEPVSDIVKETSYRVYFISDSNEKISNENIVIADKKDKDTTKRMFRLRFNFKNKKYDKSQKYYLVAYDDKNDIEVLRHEIIMDIAFADDFGFFT